MALLDRLKPEDQRIDAGVRFPVGPPRPGDTRAELIATPRLAPRADTLLQVGHKGAVAVFGVYPALSLQQQGLRTGGGR